MSSEADSSTVAFSQLAGHPALDLVNTVDWRLDPARRGERLVSVTRVFEWCHVTGLLSYREHAALTVAAAAQPRVAAREHEAVLGLREDVYAALLEHSGAAAQRVADRSRAALARCELRPHGEEWGWMDREVTLTTPLDRIARVTLDLFTDARVGRLRQCQDDSCGWVYMDTSPRRNRLWCSATDCGNRNRARRYYRRHHGDAG